MSTRHLSYALGQLFSRRWWWVTLAVIAICLGLARLGVWQLDRLAARRARNAELISRLSLPPLRLSGAEASPGAEAASLAYRLAVVRGRFDYAQELALVNQIWDGQLGFHLVTPLVIEGSEQAVLVDRGWVPATTAAPGTPRAAGGAPLATRPEAWVQYHPAPPADGAPVEVTGWVKLIPPGAAPRAAPAAPATPAGQADRLIADLDVSHLQARVTHPLLPLMVVQLPADGQGRQGGRGDGQQRLPYRQLPNPDLGDGVHLIAALQWFAFSLIGAIGYVVYLGRQLPEGPGEGG
ncbi:MAG TPA: SURF1 family protein [Chloroflexota bacterium]|nr:SURF1 family protein [Chloroflexota bacterium]